MFEWSVTVGEDFCSSSNHPGIEPTLSGTVRIKTFDCFETAIEMRVIALNNVIGGGTVFDLFESEKFLFASDNVGHNRKENRIISGILIVDRT